VLGYDNFNEMGEHIRPLRLFDLSQADRCRKPIELEPWEKEHLQQCEECQQVVEVFARQFKSEDKD
jgi:hypothetical protein